MNITANNFNDFHMKYYYNFIRLREYVLVNTRPTSPNLSYKQHYPVNNIKIPIKCNPDPPKFDIVTPLCNDTKFITSVNTENKFISPVHEMIIKKDQERKEGIEI